MKLFTRGNSKVGAALVFNLPVFKTCPGSTLFCRTYCYGDWGHNRWPSARRRVAVNYLASLRADFPALALAELEASHRRLCRVHSVGDFYSAPYVRKWVDIATAAPLWTFWAYTRSWRVPDILQELEHLAALPNFWLWLSADSMTKLPPDVPGVRGVAWMQALGENLGWMRESRRSILVFPVKDDARLPVKRIGLALVCPHYSGTPEPPTCEGCRFCFTDSPG